jgi:hypothetical protein
VNTVFIAGAATIFILISAPLHHGHSKLPVSQFGFLNRLQFSDDAKKGS